MAAKRMTPVDGGEQILKNWQSLHRDYAELGLSNHQIHKQISAIYNCSPETVRRWLRPDVRLEKNRRQRLSYIPYSKDPRINYRRLHSRLYTDIRRNPLIYLREIYFGRDVALSLDEITDCLHKLSGIEVRKKSLLKIVAQYEHKHGKKILVENGSKQDAYRLNT